VYYAASTYYYYYLLTHLASLRYVYFRNKSQEVYIRGNRYISTEADWQEARSRAGDVMRDNLGESYRVPLGMSSSEEVTSFPSFWSTPHHIGNRAWGGTEYIQFQGLLPIEKFHRFFRDVDPITGEAIRSATRLQLNYRIERSALFPNIISSQGRCHVPTNKFNDNGNGCFSFHPVLWYDDQVVKDEKAARKYHHTFLGIPAKVLKLATVGSFLSVGLILLGSLAWRHENKREVKFRSKIYID
jgi:hypothetical protein